MKTITFEALPELVHSLIAKVESLEQTLQNKVLDKAIITTADKWLNIDELKVYLPDHPAKATIYGWVHYRRIPHHKGGKKLRFLKSEIDVWLKLGKRKSLIEMEMEANKYLTKKKGGQKYE